MHEGQANVTSRLFAAVDPSFRGDLPLRSIGATVSEINPVTLHYRADYLTSARNRRLMIEPRRERGTFLVPQNSVRQNFIAMLKIQRLKIETFDYTCEQLGTKHLFKCCEHGLSMPESLNEDRTIVEQYRFL